MNDAHFEHISKKCDEIYESLEIKKQNVFEITKQMRAAAAETQK